MSGTNSQSVSASPGAQLCTYLCSSHAESHPVHSSESAYTICVVLLRLLRQAASSNSCPTGFTTAFKGPTTDPPSATTDQVQFSTLRGLGWSLSSDERPNNTAAGNAIATSAPDFWSVVCTSFGNVAADRKSCTKNPTVGAGAVHVRYSCGSPNTFWVLLYVYKGLFFNTNSDNIWAVYECGGK